MRTVRFSNVDCIIKYFLFTTVLLIKWSRLVRTFWKPDNSSNHYCMYLDYKIVSRKQMVSFQAMAWFPVQFGPILAANLSRKQMVPIFIGLVFLRTLCWNKPSLATFKPWSTRPKASLLPTLPLFLRFHKFLQIKKVWWDVQASFSRYVHMYIFFEQNNSFTEKICITP
jgi:hypothetical protein